jgi:hypothetical protein
LDRAELIERRDRLARDHGPWREDLALGAGVYTRSERAPDAEQRVAAILQTATDALGGALAQSRVIDRGAAEGLFAVEFASQGAVVVALEGREGNAQKLRFASEVLGLPNLEVVRADVRNLCAARYGQFDLVLCLGLLYHLEAEEAVLTARRIAEVCRRVAIVDTHVTFRGRTRVHVDGQTYTGTVQREFDPGAAMREQERLSRSSIGNPASFWPTWPSLYNLLGDAGFSSASEVVWPRHKKTSDRVTLVAYHGARAVPRSFPNREPVAFPRWPERDRRRPHPNQGSLAQIKRHIGPFLPGALKELVRRRRERVR